MSAFRFLIWASLSAGFFGAAGQTTTEIRKAAFYNVENLFDTTNDPASDDGDFAPEGIYNWTPERFRAKTERIARVLAEIGADLVGLAEVENRSVLDSLTAHPSLAELGYDYVLFDSPDPRGIDAALLYRRACFRPESMQPVRYRRLPRYRTRELLHVSGLWRGHPTHVLVCHLPSALSPGQVRRDAAESVGRFADSLSAADPERLLLLMGDFNANPGSATMHALMSGGRIENPFLALYRKGYGSYHYRGRWNMYDSVLTAGRIPGQTEARVFVRDYLLQRDGPYRQYPHRTFSGTEYIGGYSDHLPVVVVFR